MKIILVYINLLLFFCNVGNAYSEQQKLNKISIQNSWIKINLTNHKNTVGYFTITNDSNFSETLISVNSKIAFITELHEIEVVNDVMKMKKLSRGLLIPPKSKIKFEPGGKHIMFKNLKQKLEVMKFYDITFIFKKGEIKIPFIVKN